MRLRQHREYFLSTVAWTPMLRGSRITPARYRQILVNAAKALGISLQ